MASASFDLTGRTALITGSSKGIGRGLAGGLLDAGCTVVLNGRDETTLNAAAASLGREHPTRVHAASFDVTDPEQVHIGFARAEVLAGPIDILVNNVGLQRRAPLIEVTNADWNQLVATNLSSAFLMGREAARLMMPRRRGKIINICSLQSAFARPGIAGYAATKGGLKMLTQGMCADLAPSGIQVNAIAPGYFQTELTADLVADEAFRSWVQHRTPAGRWGQIEDLTGALIFLASSASDFVCGQLLFVDGGMSAVL